MLAEYFKENQEYDYFEIPEKAFALYRIYENELHFGHMFVAPPYRSTGVAQALGNAICAIGKERGCKYASCIVTLNDKTTAKATRLVKIYMEFGYEIVEIIGNSQIIMKKDLI